MKKLTTEEIIQKFIIVHGEKYKYDKVNYTGTHNKVKIKCLLHGYFDQTPLNHLQESGCPKCKGDNLRHNQTKSKEQFIHEAKEVHGENYSYEHVAYKDGRIEVKILCPLHGIFSQTPQNHIHRKSGCPECAIEKKAKLQTLTTQEFIEKSKQIHGNRYDYSNSAYSGHRFNVNIKCSVHGNFIQNAGIHLIGSGCPKCSHRISRPEIDFLNYLQIPLESRNKTIPSQGKQKRAFKVDAYVKSENTIYEFLGDFWHGNPKKFNRNSYNKMNKSTFGTLCDKTFYRMNKLFELGYAIKYVWESDWKNFKNGVDKELNMITYFGQASVVHSSQSSQ